MAFKFIWKVHLNPPFFLAIKWPIPLIYFHHFQSFFGWEELEGIVGFQSKERVVATILDIKMIYFHSKLFRIKLVFLKKILKVPITHIWAGKIFDFELILNIEVVFALLKVINWFNKVLKMFSRCFELKVS